VEEFVGLDDPDRWRVDEESDIQYRRATEEERDENGWIVGSYLVEIPERTQATEGKQSLTISIPYNDTRVDRFRVEHEEERDGPGASEFQVGSASAFHGDESTVDEDFHLYQSNVTETHGAYLIVSSAGGMSGKAILDERVVTIKGPEEHWNLDELSSPASEPAEREALALVQFTLHQTPVDSQDCLVAAPFGNADETCTARSDSDSPADGGISSTTHTQRNYGMAGEIQWCTDNKGNWNSMLSDIGWTVKNGFSDTVASMNYEWNICWFADSVGDAEDCDQDGGYPDCYHHFWGHEYPMNGCDRYTACYASNAWEVVDHARKHSDFAGLDVINVVHWEVMENSKGDVVVCGGAYDSSKGSDLAGAGVSTDWDHYSNSCPSYVATHEVGHNFNANHCDSEKVDGTWTVMASSGDDNCRRDTSDVHNYFSSTNEDTVDDCARSSDCPRDSRR